MKWQADSPMSAVTMVDWFSGMETEVWSWSMLRESSLTSCWLWLSSDRSSEYSSSSLRKKESQPPLAETEDKFLENMTSKDKKDTQREIRQIYSPCPPSSAVWARTLSRPNIQSSLWSTCETERLLLWPHTYTYDEQDPSNSLVEIFLLLRFPQEISFLHLLKFLKCEKEPKTWKLVWVLRLEWAK